MIKVKIESTNHKYDTQGIKEFEHLEDAIWACWRLADNNDDYYDGVIVAKPEQWDHETKRFIKPDYDFELEIYNAYRE
jgi:uncharacterized protein YcnI